MTPAQLCDHIVVRFHKRARVDFRLITERLSAAPSPIRSAWEYFGLDLDRHMRHEEAVVFPAIRLLSTHPGSLPRVQTMVVDMDLDHGELRRNAAWVRDELPLAAEARSDIEAFLAELEEHATLEDDHLFLFVRSPQEPA